jgi:protein CrcB
LNLWRAAIALPGTVKSVLRRPGGVTCDLTDLRVGQPAAEEVEVDEGLAGHCVWGGAAGATARYLVFVTSSHLLGHGFPFGTLIVNILGSFLLGILAEGMALVWTVPTSLRLFLVVGFLGAFTTFSTFSLDLAVLYERGQMLRTHSTD